MDTIDIPGIPTRVVGKPEYMSDEALVGIDGNAYSIMAVIDRGLKRDGAPKAYRDDVIEQMTSGDYDNLMAVAVRYSRNPEGA